MSGSLACLCRVEWISEQSERSVDQRVSVEHVFPLSTRGSLEPRTILPQLVYKTRDVVNKELLTFICSLHLSPSCLPCNLKTCLVSNWTVSRADGSLGRATMWSSATHKHVELLFSKHSTALNSTGSDFNDPFYTLN